MKKSFPKYCATFIALAGAGFVMLTAPAFAKMSNHKQANDKMEKIVVIGAPIERTRVVGRSEIGAPIEVIELRRQVSYADLDLKKYADVMKIKSRIQKVAKESCKDLSNMFPLNPSDISEVDRCTRKAVAGTKEQVKEAIANAS